MLWSALALAAAVPMDGWIRAQLAEGERASARAAAAPRIDALRITLTREISLLAAIRSFAESQQSRASLERGFPTFVDGVRSGSSVRALQLVEGGRIVTVWPLAGNENTLGFDLSTHPVQVVRDDVLRAMATSRVTITGPITLVQGGTGLLVRQRLPARAGFPELAAVIIDVDTLVAHSGIPDSVSGLHIELRDRRGKWFGGNPHGSAFAPETLLVATEDGDLRALIAPMRGWGVATAPWRNTARGILFVLILSAGMVGWLVGRRRDRLEAEVRRSATALELVLHTGRMGGWEEDVRSGRVRWTPSIQRVIGRDSNELGERFDGLLDLIDSDGRERLMHATARARTGAADGFVEEVRFKSVTGEVRWLLAMAEVKRDTAGHPVALLGVVTDSTERRALEERLRHAQRLAALGRLAGSVGADFDRLLESVGAAGDQARALLPRLPAEVASNIADEIGEMSAAVRRGAHLTQQLLEFSQRAAAVPAPLDLSAAVAELLPTLTRLMPASVRVDTRLAPHLPLTALDGGQFGQVLVNLAVNARDAMPDGGTITVSTFSLPGDAAARPQDAPTGEWVVLRVEDRGIGMSPATRERIFEPYFTTKPLGRGTGLGLAVVYGIVEGSGGLTVVHSAEGEGTVFDIYFPIHGAGGT